MTSIILSIIYHPPHSQRNENIILTHHILKNLDAIFSKQTNALVIITGDFNPNSTCLQPTERAMPNSLKQHGRSLKRAILGDWMFVNKPKMFNFTRLPKIGSSDHYMILTKPKPKPKAKPVIKKIKIRDTRDSAWCTFGKWIVNKNWSSILNVSSYENRYDAFMSKLNRAIDTFLPLQTIKNTPLTGHGRPRKLRILLINDKKPFFGMAKNR